MKPLRIVFMGTPEFAVASLDAIHTQSQHQVVGVVTVPDKPAGRGRLLQESAVKKYALQENIPILQPEKLKDEAFLNALKAWQADVFMVIAFRMLPAEVWKMPPKGTFNLHGSLLPQYRGAAPINRAVMNGEKETGVTTFFLDEKMDAGAIIFSEKIAIAADETAGELHDEMKIIGSQLVIKTLDAIAQDSVVAMLQTRFNIEKSNLKEAHKIFRSDCEIDWNQPAQQIFNQIRGLSPYPAAFTQLKDPSGSMRTLKIFEAKITKQFPEKTIPIFHDTQTHALFFKTNDDYLELLEVQIDGKKRMKIAEFLNGFSISDCEMIAKHRILE